MRPFKRGSSEITDNQAHCARQRTQIHDPVLVSDRADYRGRFPDIRPRLIPECTTGVFPEGYL